MSGPMSSPCPLGEGKWGHTKHRRIEQSEGDWKG